MGLLKKAINWGIRKSPWILHFNAGACNGCDIETIAALTPRFDLERMGVIQQGSPRHADILVCTGAVTDLFPALALHERELVNLFGAVVEGLPGDSSFPLPDGWPEGSYPMRKDWNPQYFDQETMTYNPPSQEVEKEGGNE